ncbi:MAG TPA: YitT family protein, partial [Candidatus Marinimicrobia bacterium]|nr:YitT family protein [Candidatus Neomarinimicrobiota bacterium]
KERNILFTVVTRKEVAILRQIVRQIDPDSFVIIANVHEVLGEGFRPRV